MAVETCEWDINGGTIIGDTYKTSCGKEWTKCEYVHHTPVGWGILFCPYCGKRIKEAL